MSFHLYQINELYSDAGGTVQYIELTVGPFNGESFWAGRSISVTQGAITHQFTFPANLPSTSTANTKVLIATQGFANLGIVTPDYIIPSGFLFTNGGLVNYAGADVLSYSQFPSDGAHALDGTGALVTPTPTDFAGATGTLSLPATGQSITGTAANETLSGGAGNDTIDGAGGTDQVNFTGNRADYTLSRSTGGFTVADHISSRDGTDSVLNVEVLQFADRSVDLLAGSRALTVPAADLKTLEELYVGFFNRVPEASGLGFWIDQLHSGATLTQIADQFYGAGVALGVYSASMTNQQFIGAIYANVLFRPPGSPHAPNDDEINFWTGYLTDPLHPEQTKGAMVLFMLNIVHSAFEHDQEFGFVAASLNNKAAVANFYAVQQGLSLNTSQENIEFGIQMAAAITPTDTAAAISLVGVNDGFSLL